MPDGVKEVILEDDSVKDVEIVWENKEFSPPPAPGYIPGTNAFAVSADAIPTGNIHTQPIYSLSIYIYIY